MRTKYLLLVALLGGCTGGSGAAPTPGPTSQEPTPVSTPSPSATVTASAAAPVRLTGDGIDLPTGVLVFGTPVEQAVTALAAALGPPTKDTGVGPSFGVYGTCPGTRLRALEYGGGALVVLFGDVKGKALTLYQWALEPKGNPADVPRASALVGDAATFEFGVGTSVQALRAGAGADVVKVVPADDPVGPQFTVQDQSSGISGSLSGTAPRDRTTFVMAGEACGE